MRQASSRARACERETEKSRSPPASRPSTSLRRAAGSIRSRFPAIAARSGSV
ncbi:hypothetical protein [Kitasatospora azatica]|uniref:hypothetical protein n=1 Tax=Kitasatospora azatica TaxID=58347 RepID=UPI001E5C33C0|nr:hypothetical protein [Kitasatospora azatica]